MTAMMTLAAAFTAFDLAGLAIIFLAWLGADWLIEFPPKSRPSVTSIMQQYRRD
jgi:hypothetical protein